ncbi:SH3 domain-containing protein 21 isoform X6 [Apteryx rowi]|uniref:SH3 domain-containing protein 21 isoform X6 n=2 Tax=Apteryx rowi TaxID=308060 RepID=UPI000E1CE306|nr:SH3 domain-containing protein 21 isoform X6 [Apteryx rowi]
MIEMLLFCMALQTGSPSSAGPCSTMHRRCLTSCGCGREMSSRSSACGRRTRAGGKGSAAAGEASSPKTSWSSCRRWCPRCSRRHRPGTWSEPRRQRRTSPARRGSPRSPPPGWSPPSSPPPRDRLRRPPSRPKPSRPPASKRHGRTRCSCGTRPPCAGAARRRRAQPPAHSGTRLSPLSAVPRPCVPNGERSKASDPDADGFGALQVCTAPLSHPTAGRPRVPGKRLPSLPVDQRLWVLQPRDGEEERPPGGMPPHSHLPAAAPGTEAPVPPRGRELPDERQALEDLKAEVRSLHILVDLMRSQHLRDLEDMRLELCQERAKRQALQAEIERVKSALPC